MATLTRGKYTYGNRTFAQILLITGASIGDTVWDTTNNRRRIWDGNYFIHGNQKSVVINATVLDGAVAAISASVNGRIIGQQTVNDGEGIIGIVEIGQATPGQIVPLVYHGDTRALVVAGSGGNAANPGDYVISDATNIGYANTAAASPGTFAHYIDAAATTTGLRRILFRPVERA